jgi:small subunit ribosomal protein S15
VQITVSIIEVAMSLTNAITRSLSQLRIGANQLPAAASNIQIRTKVTKTKKLRLIKKANALPKRLPPNHIPKSQSIIVSPTAQRESLARTPEPERLSNLLSSRSSKLSQESPPLRYNFTNLQDEMSPKLRKLFDLTNGSSNELAKAQKSRAMELFEMRPGDTGSSAVQIMALTSRIQQMQQHVAVHKKEFSGKRGLDAMYVRRRKLLDYLETKDFDTYSTVVKALGLVR